MPSSIQPSPPAMSDLRSAGVTRSGQGKPNILRVPRGGEPGAGVEGGRVKTVVGCAFYWNCGRQDRQHWRRRPEFPRLLPFDSQAILCAGILSDAEDRQNHLKRHAHVKHRDKPNDYTAEQCQ